jgi:hypothetical protein
MTALIALAVPLLQPWRDSYKESGRPDRTFPFTARRQKSLSDL